MEHQLRVTLDKSTEPWTVDIDQHDNANHIARDQHPQTMYGRWKAMPPPASCNR